MISPETILRVQAVLILETFTTAVYPPRAVGLSESFGDLAGVLAGGGLIIVRLKECASRCSLDTLRVEKLFANDIRLMRCWSRVSAIRNELWIFNAAGSWQFFEVPADGLREVFRDG